MVKNNKAKRRANRARPSRRRRSVARMTTAPPLQSFNKQLMNTVLRGSVTKGISNNSLLVVDFSVKELMSSYSQLPALFSEFKIQRVKVWAYTTLSTASSGVATLLVAPSDEVSQKITSDQLASSPGAITRRIWQPFHCNYYPTSPSEREWFGSDLNRQLLTLQFLARDIPTPSDAVTKNELQIIWDVHVRCRGLKIAKSENPLDSFEVMTMN